MTENHQPFVSPDKLSRPEQAELIASAGVRNAVDYAGMQNALAALYPQLEQTPMRVDLSQEPAYQSVYSQPVPAQPTPQSYTAMPEYQVHNNAPQPSQYNGDGASMDLYTQPTAEATTNYLSAIAEPVPDYGAQNTGAAYQHDMTADAQAMADAARQQLAELGN